ncbi:MAG: xanthine dehydrogenase family protein subunit M [Microthrixaceae bacterium]|nr:xanthine dehydrogenase family protein subunit M [Microthrixaceae bacterium]
MIPAAFAYHRPETVDETVALLSELGDEATVLAGGQSLLPMMKLRLAAPEAVIDIGRVPDLRFVREGKGHLVIGALTRHHDLERDPLVGKRCPLLGEVAKKVGDPQIRHRGTFGGTLAHGDPAADLPAVAVALDATIVVVGPQGRREIPASALYRSYFETSIAADELIVEVRIPFTEGAGGYEKFTRQAQDWATVGVLAARCGGTIRVALVSMGHTTLRAGAVELALAGGASIDEAAALAAVGTAPVEDLRAGVEYREHLCRVLTRRALEAASA